VAELCRGGAVAAWPRNSSVRVGGTERGAAAVVGQLWGSG